MMEHSQDSFVTKLAPTDSCGAKDRFDGSIFPQQLPPSWTVSPIRTPSVAPTPTPPATCMALSVWAETGIKPRIFPAPDPLPPQPMAGDQLSGCLCNDWTRHQ